MLLDNNNNNTFEAVLRAVFLVTGSAILVDLFPTVRRIVMQLLRYKDSPIAARFHMVSGSRDTQQSADVALQGAATAAFLRVGTKEPGPTWADCVRRMRRDLELRGHAQQPELTSSYNMNVHETMYLVPPALEQGTRRALLIGIHYQGQGDKELMGCHNDVHNIRDYLVQTKGFDPANMTLLLDEEGADPSRIPTRHAIEEAFRSLCATCQAGDVVVIQFSGHGGRIEDVSGDERDGFDSTLLPVDHATAGCILDDAVLQILVRPMPAGVYVTVLMDCCHSGTMLDLPYRYVTEKRAMVLDGPVLDRILHRVQQQRSYYTFHLVLSITTLLCIFLVLVPAGMGTLLNVLGITNTAANVQ